MSKNKHYSPAEPESKFTKGEKCIFTHLVLTFILILILIIIFGIHLYIVRHSTLYGIFSTRRNFLDTKQRSGSERLVVGYLYLNISTIKFVCNTLLLKARWSLCTAHCVAARTDPDMAHLLFAWKLKYKLVIEDNAGQETAEFVTPIKKSIAHSLFERETFTNNIGLLEHLEPYPLLVPNLNNAPIALTPEDRNNILIIGWNHSETETAGKHKIEQISYDAQHVTAEDCLEAVSPVTEVRRYEFCVKLRDEETFLDYGAVVFLNSNVMGIFSWGERLQKQLPMVIINITMFQNWLQIIATS